MPAPGLFAWERMIDVASGFVDALRHGEACHLCLSPLEIEQSSGGDAAGSDE